MIDLWWNSLTTALQVFYTVAWAATALLLLQLLLTLFGFDGDGDADFDADGHGSGLGILSVRSVTAFFAGFGWGGVVALRAGLGLTAATLVALAIGGTLMTAVVALMRAFAAMRHSGTLDYANAVGVVGNVYLPIPGGMQGPGQVEVLVQGRLCVVQAFTRAPEQIPSRARVRVTETLDQQTLVVEPLQGAAAATSSRKN
ncbi:MAG TPA: hypothetical protein VHQ65_11495 [Thermoanaerobaculia bacterium]|nr:hypothetical protein [Thermoanaerobaculia bacterium]